MLVDYRQLKPKRPTIPVGSFSEPGPGWLLTLDGTWEWCKLEFSGWTGSTIRVSETRREAYAMGTSGSPILNAECQAVGVISLGDLNPVLAANLRAELVRELMDEESATDALKVRRRLDQERKDQRQRIQRELAASND